MSNALGAGAPGAGGDQGGFLQWLQGLAPQAQSAIMRVMQNANPVQPAAAGGAPDPNSDAARQAALAAAGAQLSGPGGAAGAPPGPAGPRITPSTLATIVGHGGRSGGGGASMPFPQNEQVAPQRSFPAPPGYGPETSHMPYPGQVDPRGVFAPKPPVAVARAPVRARPTVRIPASATALAPPGAAGGGYYTGQAGPGMGGARNPTFTSYVDPNDPRIFRGGPLAR